MAVNVLKFAAIDIGSNAVRLLVSNIAADTEEKNLKKAALIRLPIRLGADAFSKKSIISDNNAKRLVKAMQAFRHLIDIHDVESFRACATSAMRDAKNGAQIAKRIKKETGIKIEIIDGKQEAEIIFSTHIADNLDKTKSYLYIDVGGGSTEVTLFAKKRMVDSNSFNIGTIRMLHEQVEKSEWKRLKKWLEDHIADMQFISGIGSGGNINKIYKIARKGDDRPMSYGQLAHTHNQLNSYSRDDRILKLGLKPDRADVIVPASEIFMNIMKWANINRLHVPQIGLADGIVHLLYHEYQLKSADSKKAESVS